MMTTEFRASGSVSIHVENLAQLGDDVAAEVERGFGSVTIPGEAGRSGSGGRQQRRVRQMARAAQDQRDELSTQTGLLEEILDALEEGVGGGGGGRRRTDTGSPDFGGALPGFAGGVAARGLPAALGIAGPIGIGAAFGIGGTRLLQDAGVMDSVRELGEDVGELPGSDILEGIGLGPGLTDIGAVTLDIAQADVTFENVRDLQSQRGDWVRDRVDDVRNVVDSVTGDTSGSGPRGPTLDDPGFDPHGREPAIIDSPVATDAVTGSLGPGAGRTMSEIPEWLRRAATTSPADPVTGALGPGSVQASGTSSETVVDATINIDATETDDLRRELDRELTQLRQDILRELPDRAGQLSATQAQRFQTRIR